MNYIKKYNNEMWGVGISDKLRNYYRIGFWVRNRKLWWLIFFWDVDIILRSAYIIYMFIHNMYGNPRKNILSHNDFINSMACAWINPEKYSAEEFKAQPKIPAPRRKIKFELYSSCLVSKMTPCISWKLWMSTRITTNSK